MSQQRHSPEWALPPGALVSALRQAIELAQGAAGLVSPNPLVGAAVLAADGRVLGLGSHRRLGGDHAEVDALKATLGLPQGQPLAVADLVQAGTSSALLSGAVMVVTLEPCAHEGRTPSCAKLLAQLPLRAVVYAVTDPNPKVNGAGRAVIEGAGIECLALDRADDSSRLGRFGLTAVQADEVRSECEDLAEVFLFNQRFGLPYISLKIATTLDSRMALKSGESKWITGEEARLHAHVLRARHDAVLVGRRTLEIDDPGLDVRHPEFPGRRNTAIVLDPHGSVIRTLESKRLHQVRREWGVEHSVIVVVAKGSASTYQEQAKRLGIRLLEVEVTDAGYQMSSLVRELWRVGLRSVLVEGGAATLSAFLAERLGQRLHQFVAPKILGARDSIGWTDGLALPDLGSALRLEKMTAKALGPDLLISGRLVVQTRPD